MNKSVRYIKEEQLKLRFQSVYLKDIPVIVREPMHTFQRFIVLVLQQGFKADNIDDVVVGLSRAFNIKCHFIAEYIDHLRNRIKHDEGRGVFYLPEDLCVVDDSTTPGIWYLETDRLNQSFTDIVFCAEYEIFVSESNLSKMNLEREYITEEACDDVVSAAVQDHFGEIASLIHASKQFKSKYGLVKPFECTVDTKRETDIYEYSVPFLVTYEYNGEVAAAVDVELTPAAKDIGIKNLRGIVLEKFKTDQNMPAFIKYDELLSEAAHEVETIDTQSNAITEIDSRISEALEDITNSFSDQTITRILHDLPIKFSSGSILSIKVSRICFGIGLVLEQINLKNNDNVFVALSGIRDAYRQTVKAVFDSLQEGTKNTVGDYFSDSQCLKLICGKVAGLELSTLQNMGKLDRLLNAICHNNDLASERIGQKNRECIEEFYFMDADKKTKLVLSVIEFLNTVKLSEVQLNKINSAMDPLAAIGRKLSISQSIVDAASGHHTSKTTVVPNLTIARVNDIQAEKMAMPKTEENDLAIATKSVLRNRVANNGKIVEFGHYYYDDRKEKHPLSWRVLAKNEAEQRVLLISEYCIDSRQYDVGEKARRWQETELRQWLRRVFLKEAFSEEEMRYLVPDVYGDLVRLLKADEAKLLFSDDADRMAVPSDFALLKGASTKSHKKNGQKTSFWWLICEEPGKLAWGISRGGEIRNGHSFALWDKGYEANSKGGTVRPVISLDTSLL